VSLVEFLRQRLDEDEQIAQAANPPPWRLRPAGTEHRLAEHVIFGGSYPGDPEKLRQVADLEAAWERAANAEHIARHDPARVLRQVEVLRRVVDCHKHTYSDAVGERPRHGCEVCHVEGDFVIGGGWSELDPDGWCETIRLLTLPYADHPDYNPAWQPAEVTT
jgi:hypothetical protein